MSSNDERNESRNSDVSSMDERRRKRDDDTRLVREALEKATARPEARVERLLDVVPEMMEEALRRRERAGRRDVLTASIPSARRAIPRLAAAAAVLVAISAALLLTGNDTATSTSTDLDDLLMAGNGVTDEMIVESILGPEEQP